MAWNNFHSYPASKPRAVKGGIRAHSKRGAFGEKWWARRWVETLESFDVASRLQRGKTYARQGQVADIKIENGCVSATVQGSSSRPYKITIQLAAFGDAERARLLEVLHSQILFAAQLMVGELSPDLEPALAAANVALFPRSEADMETTCSCPDWSNPCKHVAAVFYLLTEEFDRDPFLLFQMHGITRETVLSALHEPEVNPETETPNRDAPKTARKTKKATKSTPSAAAPTNANAAGEAQSPDVQPPDVQPHDVEPLNAEHAAFWEGGALPADFASSAATIAAPLRRLGGFPFWRGQKPILESLEPLYRCAAAGASE